MSSVRLQIVKLVGLLSLATVISLTVRPVMADVVQPADQDVAASAATNTAAAIADDDEDDWSSRDRRVERRHRRQRNHDGDVVNFGSDSVLPAGGRADSVVSIFGSSISEGDASETVSIFGNSRATGPVAGDAVSVFGSTYIDSKVDGDAVAVFGNVDLGPHADVGGDVVAVLGKVRRDPAAIVHGGVNSIFATSFGEMQGLHAWITQCLLYGRPLAVALGLGWAWTIAAGFLAFYILLAVMFRQGIGECVATVENHPGRTALAALLGTLLTPVLLVLLFVTVIGIAAVPFVVAALFCACLFGKAVMLAWVGHRVIGTRANAVGHPALAVLVGGVLVTVLYLVPVLGIVFYKALGIFGFGAVVYTVILRIRAREATKTDRPNPVSPEKAAPAAAESAPPVSPGPAPAATSTRAYVSATAALPRAGFWIRMAALLLDVLLIGFLTSVFHLFRGVPVALLVVYGALMWKLRGTTVGGIIFDLQVVRLDGRAVDWETSVVRALGCLISLFVAGLGFIWIAFDRNNQAWHDKIAGTVVVRIPKV